MREPAATEEATAPVRIVFQLRADHAFFSALDRLRRAESDLPSRSEMVRRIVVEADTQLRRRTPANRR